MKISNKPTAGFKELENENGKIKPIHPKGRLQLRASVPVTVFCTQGKNQTLLGTSDEFDQRVPPKAVIHVEAAKGVRVFLKTNDSNAVQPSGPVLTNLQRKPLESGSMLAVQRRAVLDEIRANAVQRQRAVDQVRQERREKARQEREEEAAQRKAQRLLEAREAAEAQALVRAQMAANELELDAEQLEEQEQAGNSGKTVLVDN